ncbi:hydroxyisourate hydrolase [Paracoccus saliphilus]|uniref:5-hydroxyisourate hydrolase n=1 Tax=Paracoccus saliphilus TaxID=405559 RepID=A0AA45W3X0_9RHOB|nr:hydroxyisourate hydrolase [Paracoccus saliphilus]WCR04263.1 hydroxyisourate hydrolase [Paracoccus saliphilus]SIS80346.1 5-hydroxyisourate hydrolase [Paracoccus saliphilus]
MPGYLTTHVLDTARGKPAEGMEVVLYRLQDGQRVELARLTTNADGRTDRQILPESEFETGVYELEFHAGAWMDTTGIPAETPRFLDVIPIRFGMSQQDHYHVPLLISPFGYSTYRGS